MTGQGPTDDRVLVVACFVTRTPFRYTGVSRALAKAAVEFADDGMRQVAEPTKRRVVMRIDF